MALNVKTGGLASQQRTGSPGHGTVRPPKKDSIRKQSVFLHVKSARIKPVNSEKYT